MDRFQEHLYRNFDTYCARHGVEKTEAGLLTFLIDQDLIPPTNVQRYAVLREFEKLHHEQEFRKTEAVDLLANRFNISTRTVWSIVKYSDQASGERRAK